MDTKKDLPTDISKLPKEEQELFEVEGQDTQPKPEAEKPKEEVKPDVVPKKENNSEKETPKPKKPDFVGVPVNQANAWRKEAKEFREKAQTLEAELLALKQKAPDISKTETDDFISEWGKKYGLEGETLTPYKELIENAIKPFKAKLSLLEKFEEKAKEESQAKEQEKAYNEYFDNSFQDFEDEIKKEHQDISEAEMLVIKNNLRLKIEKEGLYQTPIALIYKAYPEFRPSPKKKTIEPSGKSYSKPIDKTSESDLAEALEKGDIDIDEVDKIMVKKGGGRFTTRS